MDLKKASKQGFQDFFELNGGVLQGISHIPPRITVDPATLGARSFRDAYEIGVGMAKSYLEAVCGSK